MGELAEAKHRLGQLPLADVQLILRSHDALEAEVERLRKGTVECEDCGFRYGAEHTLHDGSYSCPECELAKLRMRLLHKPSLFADKEGNPGPLAEAEVERLREENRELKKSIEETVAYDHGAVLKEGE